MQSTLEVAKQQQLQNVINQFSNMGRTVSPYYLSVISNTIDNRNFNELMTHKFKLTEAARGSQLNALNMRNDVYKNTTRETLDTNMLMSIAAQLGAGSSPVQVTSGGGSGGGSRSSRSPRAKKPNALNRGDFSAKVNSNSPSSVKISRDFN